MRLGDLRQLIRVTPAPVAGVTRVFGRPVRGKILLIRKLPMIYATARNVKSSCCLCVKHVNLKVVLLVVGNFRCHPITTVKLFE